MTPFRLLLCIVPLFGIACQAPPAQPTVHMAAAVSTVDVVEEIARSFKDETGIAVDVTPAASSVLAKQIEKGADADLFLSADEEWADYLADRKLVETRRDLLGNRLVVAAPGDSVLKLAELAEIVTPAVRQLALAGPSVPAGRYARQSLEKAGVWDKIKDRVVEAGDVRAALALVVKGEADAGIVYVTDARAAGDKVRPILIIPDELHQPIRYPLMLLDREPIQPQARRFYEYLAGDKAAAVFRKAGFTMLP
ncbi:MAG TPA: molybdate ABC transporter substrate-binding protein [Gemmataceae bacterium]|nr:molybdate ABC transporter substrate-binding protein [Gemmataceae bacterium]